MSAVKAEPCVLKQEEVPPPDQFLDFWEKRIREEFLTTMNLQEDTPSGPQVKYLNWNHYFSTVYPDTIEGNSHFQSYIEKVKGLYQQVVRVAPGEKGNKIVPANLIVGPLDKGSMWNGCVVDGQFSHLVTPMFPPWWCTCPLPTVPFKARPSYISDHP